MSIHLTNAVWRNAMDLSGSKLIMMLAICDAANDEGRAWPSMTTLAKKARLSKKQTRRVVHYLDKNGYVSMQKRPGRSAIFEVNLERLGLTGQSATPPADESPTPPAGGSTPMNGSSPISRPSPLPPVGAHPSHSYGSHPSHPREPESLKNRKGTIKEESPNSLSAGGQSESAGGQSQERERGDSIFEALAKINVFGNVASDVMVKFYAAAGRALTPEDVAAWGRWLEAENAGGARVTSGLVVTALRAGRTADEAWYEDAGPAYEIMLANERMTDAPPQSPPQAGGRSLERAVDEAMPLEETLAVLRSVADAFDEPMAAAVDGDDEAMRWWEEALTSMRVSYGGRYDRAFAQCELIDAADDELVVVCANEVVRAQMGRLARQLELRLAQAAGQALGVRFVLARMEVAA